jgi:hypothetical protein
MAVIHGLLFYPWSPRHGMAQVLQVAAIIDGSSHCGGRAIVALPECMWQRQTALARLSIHAAHSCIMYGELSLASSTIILLGLICDIMKVSGTCVGLEQTQAAQVRSQ